MVCFVFRYGMVNYSAKSLSFILTLILIKDVNKCIVLITSTVLKGYQKCYKMLGCVFI